MKGGKLSVSKNLTQLVKLFFDDFPTSEKRYRIWEFPNRFANRATCRLTDQNAVTSVTDDK